MVRGLPIEGFMDEREKRELSRLVNAEIKAGWDLVDAISG